MLRASFFMHNFVKNVGLYYEGVFSGKKFLFSGKVRHKKY